MTKGETTRKKILEQAAPIFNRNGYEGSSLSALMKATGLKKGGIYRHFSSKEELAAEAFDYTWQEAWRARILPMDEQTMGVERLKQLISNFIEHKSPVPGGCPILNTAVDADDGNSVLRTRVRKALRSWLALLRVIVRQAAKRGELQTGIDAKAVATLIVASLEGGLMMSRLEGNDDALRKVQRHLNHYLDTEVAAPQSTAGGVQ
jgi:TetR/AcrR family transcriptional regulator, transcriptional repressor for nem operon